jgi:hypothetical protein
VWLYFVLMRLPAQNGPRIEGAAQVSFAVLAVAALGATVAILGRMGHGGNVDR